MGWAEKLKDSEKRGLVDWARRNVRGVDDAAVFVGITDDRPMDAARAEYTLQIGHALLTDKPIIIAAPHGWPLSSKLLRVADRVVRYDPGDVETMKPGMTQALAELGVTKQ
jgi:hypothetical protein